MDTLPLYHAAHLIAAAIRVIEFRDQQPPSAAGIASLLSVSTEQVLRICRKIEQHGVVKIVTAGYGEKLFIRDHLAIESLSQEAPGNDIAEELEKFKKKQSERDKKIEAIKQKEEERKKKLFARIEEQFKGNPPGADAGTGNATGSSDRQSDN